MRLPSTFAFGLLDDPFENLDFHSTGFGRSCVDPEIKGGDAVVF
jgi:hypothetical protein